MRVDGLTACVGQFCRVLFHWQPSWECWESFQHAPPENLLKKTQKNQENAAAIAVIVVFSANVADVIAVLLCAKSATTICATNATVCASVTATAAAAAAASAASAAMKARQIIALPYFPTSQSGHSRSGGILAMEFNSCSNR